MCELLYSEHLTVMWLLFMMTTFVALTLQYVIHLLIALSVSLTFVVTRVPRTGCVDELPPKIRARNTSSRIR